MFVMRLLYFVFGLIFLTATGRGESEDLKEWNERFSKFEEYLNNIPSAKEDWEQSWEEEYKEDELPIPPFTCEVLPEYVPARTVHELKPSDIKVMAAMGDSITAANGVGADTLPGVAVENRGFSWSIGGNETLDTVLTLPNLIRQYNPYVKGYSWSRDSRTDRNDTHCDNNMYCSQLNVAEPGATNRGMLGQAERIIAKMLDDNATKDDIDFENDWKLITMFVGGNDLCRICDNWESYSPEAYRDGVQRALDLLHAEVPRALVQIVLYFDITPLANISTGVVCDGMHWGFCACGRRPDTVPLMKGYQMEYSNLLEELVNSGRYDTRDNFTVVIQPHQRDIGPVLDENGEVDHSYFAPDCFHLSLKGHMGQAYMLWNVMLTPVGKKPYEYDAYEDVVFRCPTQEHPYIFTNQNSDVEWNATVTKKPETKSSSLTGPEEWKEKTRKFSSWLQEDPERIATWRKQWEEYATTDGIDIPPFTCNTEPPLEPIEPQSVHELTPFDINVIAALGDSITAGNGVGADTLPGVAIENRGESWCIGGNETIETILTIPNLLREFNPALTGWSYSRDPGINEDRNKTHCGNALPCSQLNVAEPGGTNRDMPPQADILISKILADPDIDNENDWKIVFLFIGGNDLCAVCRRWDDYNPQNYVDNIKLAIDKMKAGMPRTMVHIVNMFDVTPLSNFSTGIICNQLHINYCDCAVYNDTVMSMMRPIQYAYWELLDELINVNGTYDGDVSFTVVLQPFMRDMPPPQTPDGEWDTSYLAPDCFHPSRKGHQSMAYMLWNELLTPVYEKSYSYQWEQVMAFKCPTEQAPYIFTNDNSRLPKENNEKKQLHKTTSEKTQETKSSKEEWNDKVKKFRTWLEENPAMMEKWIKDWEEYEQTEGIDIPPLTCNTEPPLQPIEPTSVHELTPFDIQVIAAFGDSITAGNGVGAETLPGVAIENRGESWCIGGNETLDTILTIPNILREFNPALTGWSYSRDPGINEDRNRTHCGNDLPCSQLNVAEPGATNRDMPPQADLLISKILADPDIDNENDWKIVFLFIGGNDLCAVCRRWDDYRPQNYLDNIKLAIDKMKAAMPRTMVHIVNMFDITPLGNFSTGILCNQAHMGFCDCAVYNDTVMSMLRPVQYAYWELLDELINVNGTYDGDDNFTVVLQPFMRDLPPPKTADGEWDNSYLAPDCFHPSRKSHQNMAYMLWNQLLTPVQEKVYNYVFEDVLEFKCPTQERPYIFTNDNSRALPMKKKATVDAKQANKEPPALVSGKVEWQQNTKKFKTWLEADSQRMEMWQKQWQEYELADGIQIPPFTCNTADPPLVEPQSVHELTPYDIQVIAAFGDSITAGNGVGADTLPGVAIENRGESWCIGGNETIETVLTIPNLLREFNPALTGWSYSRDPGRNEDRNKTHCGNELPCSQLNVAEPGGTNRDMPPQADILISKIFADPDIDNDNDWKIVFMFIGGNDLCAVCRRWDDYNPQNYVDNIKLAIDKMKAAMPRTMVHIVNMFDISPLSNFSTGIICDQLHINYCDCAVYNDTVLSMMRPIQYAYWELLDELINVNGTYDGDDSFTVVLEPYMRDTPPPVTADGEWDTSYLAPDCFHPSLKGHQAMAYALWNQLLTPVPEKTFNYGWQPEEEMEFKCPTEEAPYIFTNDNSRRMKEPKKAKAAIPAHEVHEESNTETDKTSGSSSVSGLVVFMVAAVGLMLVAFGIVVIMPYWKKSRKHQPLSTSNFDNPAFEPTVHVLE